MFGFMFGYVLFAGLKIPHMFNQNVEWHPLRSMFPSHGLCTMMSVFRFWKQVVGPNTFLKQPEPEPE